MARNDLMNSVHLRVVALLSVLFLVGCTSGEDGNRGNGFGFLLLLAVWALGDFLSDKGFITLGLSHDVDNRKETDSTYEASLWFGSSDDDGDDGGDGCGCSD